MLLNEYVAVTLYRQRVNSSGRPNHHRRVLNEIINDYKLEQRRHGRKPNRG